MSNVKLRTMAAVAGGAALLLFVLTYFVLTGATPIAPTYDVRLGLTLANVASWLAFAVLAVAGFVRLVLPRG